MIMMMMMMVMMVMVMATIKFNYRFLIYVASLLNTHLANFVFCVHTLMYPCMV